MSRSASEHRAPSPAPSRSRAVVLCAPGAPPPPVLLQALHKRRVDPLPAHDPFAAMLLLARASDAGGGRAAALIVVAPALHGAGPLDDLVRAARRHVPGAALWEFDADGRPPLRGLSLARFSDQPRGTNGTSNGAGQVVVQPRGRPVTPQLRLTDSPAAPLSERPDDQPSALLSEEELAMLLADDLDTPTTR